MNIVTVSITDAGKALSLSRSKIYELLQSGDLTFVKIGRRSLVTVESIHALIKRSSAGWAV